MNPYNLKFGNYFGMLIIIIFVGFIIWLLIRELRCWYFKINERVELLESINRNLEILVERTTSDKNKE